MKILVTGQASYIGSHIVSFLGSKDCYIIVFNNLITGYEENVNCKLIFVNSRSGDLTELVSKSVLSKNKLNWTTKFSDIESIISSICKIYNR